MENFFYIFLNILLPIFIQIIIGYFIQSNFKLSINTLSKVQMYVFIPALMFYNIYSSKIGGDTVLNIVLFTTGLFIIMSFLSLFIAKLFKMSKIQEKAFINSTTLINQGNFGIPIIGLLFAGELSGQAMSLHMTMLMTTSLLLGTVGLYNTSSGTYTGKEALINVLRLPIIYAIGLGFLFRTSKIDLPMPIDSTLNILGQGVIPVALFTLGAQLSETKMNLKNYSVYLSNFLRLIISPLFALLLLKLFNIEDLTSKILIIGAACPTAVNSVLMAIEFDGDVDYASQTVFISTLLSAVTVTIVIGMI